MFQKNPQIFENKSHTKTEMLWWFSVETAVFPVGKTKPQTSKIIQQVLMLLK